MWLSKEECTETVSKAWKEGEGCAPHQRIALCAKQLTKWATKSFGELKKKISKCEAALQEAQGAQIDARMLDTCEKLAEEINELRRMEESYWYTRSRANEMRDGDKNTAYFHRKASQRKKKNRIDGLFDLSGEWRTDEGQIRSIISEYFGSLFSTDNPTDFATALEGVERVVSDDMNNVMDLMVDGALCWDAAKVRELLDDESAAAVLSTPLPQHNKANCRYWSYTKNGIFSVKTTYWLARSVGNEVVVSSHAEELWNLIVFENETPNFVLLAAGFCKLVSDYDEYAKKVFLPIPQPSVGSSMRCLNNVQSPNLAMGYVTSGRGYVGKVNALPDLPLMAVLVQHAEGQRELITHKSIWHLSDNAIKNVYTFYVMFTCWGCCFFGATKDPYYDSEQYRGDGGDGTGHWVYEKQEDIEESARAALWREELIEEIEQKVGGLRELEDAGRKEELLK
uniref:Uncharacterized protein n=1 Tax=Chenopodium quinoa TaxID=63459 RepID=A0A803L998_CHEQI